jgi:hypothetical protein
MEGETHTYSWEHGAPGEDGLANEPEGANIHWVNTKSKYKPIVIVSPDSEPEFDIYAGELRRDVSMFPWWNHWPTAQKPCDGRYAMDSDLASHSSLSHCSWKAYAQTENSMTKIMINGLTDKSAKEQLPLAKSWATPAELKVKGDGFCSDGYDPTQRAYVLNCKSKGSVLNIELAASDEQPIFNPAFVINGWGTSDAELKINGKEIKCGSDFRFGHRHGLEGSDLIVWIKKESVKPTEFTVFSLSN